MRLDYYSEDWFEATEKFIKSAFELGELDELIKVKWAIHPTDKFDIPYVSIGKGPNKIVNNSGIHGLEGYFGSAAQIWALRNLIPRLSKEFLEKYTVVFIHAINGWGMQNRMREVMDPHGGLVDLNRNFGIDFSKPENLPKNEKYRLAHNLLLSEPDAEKKKNALKAFRSAHIKDGVWSAISNGQYYEPFGLFFGGNHDMSENKMTLRIYDEIMKGAESLYSIGFHTGLGRFDRKKSAVTAGVYVSHTKKHPNTQKFQEIFGPSIEVIPDENAVTGPTILGDLVDCLENRYAHKNIPIYTADFEIGTGEFPVMSPIYKRMDMGDARYDLLNYDKINDQTLANLTESWYPSDKGWRQHALYNAEILFHRLFSYLENTK